MKRSLLCLIVSLSLALAACRGLESQPEQAPAATLAAPLPTPTPPPAITPSAESASAIDHPPTPTTESLPAPGWTCLAGELPPADETAIAEAGPSPDLPPSPAEGEKLTIYAVIYSRDCQPLSGASVRMWQTDEQGVYGPGHGGQDLQCCYFQAELTTGSNGRFDLVTVRPGVYAGEAAPPPAHIHVEVSHPDQQTFGTEIVFLGDPYLPDPLLSGFLPIQLEQSGSLSSPEYSGIAEIVLP